MQEVAADHKKIFILAGSGSHPEITARVAKNYDRYKYFFRGGTYSAINIVTVALSTLPDMAKKIREDLGVEKVKLAMLFEQAKWLDPQIPLYNEQIPKMGIEVVGIWRMSINALDVSAQLMAIKESGAHIILAMTSGPVAIPMYRQIGELEIPALITGVNVEAEGAKFYEATGGLCAYSTYLTQQSDVEITWRTKPFYEKFRKRYGENPSMTATAYNSLLILKEAIERAQTLDTDRVVEALEKTDFQGTGGRMVFNKEHDGVFGPGYLMNVGVQIMPGNVLHTWFPKNYKGTKELQIPPWMLKYWKGRSDNK
jgi:branched-chain amino acid transport system substrate-binding protein